jgi:hypothetical protein
VLEHSDEAPERTEEVRSGRPALVRIESFQAKRKNKRLFALPNSFVDIYFELGNLNQTIVTSPPKYFFIGPNDHCTRMMCE